jgi:hypothetical protein
MFLSAKLAPDKLSNRRISFTKDPWGTFVIIFISFLKNSRRINQVA